jgi:GTP-binding protein
MFVDRVQIELFAGNGGNGCLSFRREKHVPRGGPNGGDGGNGGSIILRAQNGVNSLVTFGHQKHWRAEHGSPGGSSNKHGRNGQDMVLDLPLGTVVIDSESGIVLKDLVQEDDTLVIARGGKGGFGNTRFKHSTNQAPRQITEGQEGQKRTVVMELKSIADVGLIGKPNAGKSTLLSRLSRARPEIADYPFTTKFPNLGQVSVGHDDGFILADIPGLIEGCHDGVGLGHDFLRHIMRAGILVHLVEPFPVDQTNPIENYLSIRNELSQYSSDLDSRAEVVVVSKAELPGSDAVQKELAEKTGKEVLLISAVTGQGLDEMIRRVQGELSRSKTA